MIVVLGVVLLVVAGVMYWLARPRNGEMAGFLKAKYVESSYAVLLVGLIGVGVACVFGGIAGG
jgi:hypothetical protein